MTYLFISVLLLAAPSSDTLLPRPTQITHEDGMLPLGEAFVVDTSGPHSPRVQRALERFSARLAQDFDAHVCIGARCQGPRKLTVEWTRRDAPLSMPTHDESYSLLIDRHHAVLRAADPVGVLRGLETLSAWTQAQETGAYWPAVRIHDGPRFVWRGLLLDVARHFMPVEVIKRNLDAMAAVKLNVLHWHLTDDQGFRVESKRFPELHTQGSQGQFYSREQIQEVLRYAADRGIRVVPEFDMPGHVQSWLVSHPELATQAGPYTVGAAWGVYEAAFDPTREETYQFIDAFLGEMSGLFPDPYLHLGGDEVAGKQWMENPNVRAFMQAHRMQDAHALQTYFFNRVNAIARRYGKHVVGWDEVLQPSLHETTVVESWRGKESLAEALRAGHHGILAEGYYLDRSAGDHYAVDPTANLHLTRSEEARILGGEACQWTELVRAETLDMSVWPRAGAIAERLWSPASVTDADDMYRRLDALSGTLQTMGLSHRTAQTSQLIALAGTPYIAPLQTMASVLEPERGNWDVGYDAGASLKGLVDALYPESLAGREINARVEHLLQSPTGMTRDAALETTFAQLRDEAPLAQSLMQRDPSLQSALPTVRTVASLADLSLEALDMLGAAVPRDHASVRAQRAWVRHAKQVLRSASSHQGHIRIAMAPAVQKLVDALDRRLGAQDPAAPVQ